MAEVMAFLQCITEQYQSTRIDDERTTEGEGYAASIQRHTWG